MLSLCGVTLVSTEYISDDLLRRLAWHLDAKTLCRQALSSQSSAPVRVASTVYTGLIRYKSTA